MGFSSALSAAFSIRMPPRTEQRMFAGWKGAFCLLDLSRHMLELVEAKLQTLLDVLEGKHPVPPSVAAYQPLVGENFEY